MPKRYLPVQTSIADESLTNCINKEEQLANLNNNLV